jgi:hypothetical protein
MPVIRPQLAIQRLIYTRSVPFDLKFVEAKLALRMIGPDEMPALAWDALEAGLDGPSIRRLGALINPSGWETDQVLPTFMAEAGIKGITTEEAAICVAQHLAHRILSEELDPLAYSRDFEALWIRADYPIAIQEVGSLDDQKAVAEYIGQSEGELREYARSVLLALVAPTEPKL